MAESTLTAGLARAGIMLLDSDLSLEPELAHVLRGCVGVHFSRVRYPGTVTAESLADALCHLEESATLLAPIHPSVLIYACTSGSFMGGVEGNRAIEQRIRTLLGVQCVTASSAVVQAMHRVGSSRIALVSPYSTEVTEALVQFLNASGIEVMRTALLFGDDLVDDVTLQSVTPGEVLDAALPLMGTDIDGLLVSCTGIRIIAELPAMEEELSVPVVSSTAAICRILLDHAGVEVSGFGQLLDGIPSRGENAIEGSHERN